MVLAGFGAGDRDAATVFVRRFQRRVHGLALAIVHDEGRAAEVAQDAFARAWRHAPAYDARRGSVLTWLLAITRHAAIDRARLEAARPADPADAALLVLTATEPGPEAATVAETEAARVRQALAALTEPQRRCVVLATIGGLTGREVAELEGIPLGTAKTRIRDGLRHVREHLALGEEAHRG
jgi:RNA polymerase sigma-70 factor (ECF subfamily)